MELPATLIFVGNVGEEGEGDLRGVRQIYQDPRFTGRIAAHLVLDGAGTETAVTQALGSRRYLVTIHGPGGHSFTDAGTPNPYYCNGFGAFSTIASISRGGRRRGSRYPECRHDCRWHKRQFDSRISHCHG